MTEQKKHTYKYTQKYHIGWKVPPVKTKQYFKLTAKKNITFSIALYFKDFQ